MHSASACNALPSPNKKNSRAFSKKFSDSTVMKIAPPIQSVTS
jgi:hypothetical protein